jgi:hypothetical protein
MRLGDMSKRMSVAEFRERGYLQELNRNFLHPLGLALEVVVVDGHERFGEVWDYRDDPEGIVYADFDDAKAQAIRQEWDARREPREQRLGYMVQPLRPTSEGEHP